MTTTEPVTAFVWTQLLRQAPAPTSRAAAVAFALASYMDKTGWCNPSVNELSRVTQLSPNTLTAAIGDLERCGRLIVSRHFGSGSGYQASRTIATIATVDDEEPSQPLRRSDTPTIAGPSQDHRRTIATPSQPLGKPSQPLRSKYEVLSTKSEEAEPRTKNSPKGGHPPSPPGDPRATKEQGLVDPKANGQGPPSGFKWQTNPSASCSYCHRVNHKDTGQPCDLKARGDDTFWHSPCVAAGREVIEA